MSISRRGHASAAALLHLHGGEEEAEALGEQVVHLVEYALLIGEGSHVQVAAEHVPPRHQGPDVHVMHVHHAFDAEDGVVPAFRSTSFGVPWSRMASASRMIFHEAQKSTSPKPIPRIGSDLLEPGDADDERRDDDDEAPHERLEDVPENAADVEVLLRFPQPSSHTRWGRRRQLPAVRPDPDHALEGWRLRSRIPLCGAPLTLIRKANHHATTVVPRIPVRPNAATPIKPAHSAKLNCLVLCFGMVRRFRILISEHSIFRVPVATRPRAARPARIG